MLTWSKLDCWRKNLQIFKPRACPVSLKIGPPEVNCFSSPSRIPLIHSPRWIYRNGYRRRRSSSWCSAAHELSKAGGAQIAPTSGRSSNAIVFVMLSLCSRTERLQTNTSTSSRRSSAYHTNPSLARVLYNKSLLTTCLTCTAVRGSSSSHRAIPNHVNSLADVKHIAWAVRNEKEQAFPPMNQVQTPIQTWPVVPPPTEKKSQGSWWEPKFPTSDLYSFRIHNP